MIRYVGCELKFDNGKMKGERGNWERRTGRTKYDAC